MAKTLNQRIAGWRKNVQYHRRNVKRDSTESSRRALARAEANLAKLRSRARTKPKVYTREQWGARAPRWRPPPLTGIWVDTLHHSAVFHGKMSDRQFAARLRQYQDYHMNGPMQAVDIGYNWAINPTTGSIFECRRGVGAHTLARNSGNNGILVDGDYTREPLPNMKLVGRSIAQCRRANRILGHREHPGQSTACPGILLHWLKSHR